MHLASGLSEKLGKDRVTIANVIRLLKLTKEVRVMVQTGELALGKAKVLLSIEDPIEQKKAALRTVKLQLTVRAVEKLVEGTLGQPPELLEFQVGGV